MRSSDIENACMVVRSPVARAWSSVYPHQGYRGKVESRSGVPLHMMNYELVRNSERRLSNQNLTPRCGRVGACACRIIKRDVPGA
eukprot:COSAG02_NODE_38_length_48090_cov_107.207060_33_plen_85_part_00